MLHALLHTAQEVGSTKSAARTAQGEYEREPVAGPVFQCRLMEKGVAPKRRRREGGEDGSAETRATLELLGWHTAIDGSPVEIKASTTYLVIAPVLTGPGGKRYEVAGKPEKLNNGAEMIGWLANVVEVADAR